MSRLIDIVGTRVGRLVVLSRAENISMKGQKSVAAWKCQCDCGATVIVRGSALRIAKTISCGCKRTENLRRGLHITHGWDGTITHKTWQAMIQRCTHEYDVNYIRYGGAGINVCDEWRSDFLNFLQDMGPRPSVKHSIDRIDNGKGYQADNCRWATQSEQQNNRRDNIRIEYQGENLTLAQWSRKLGIRYETLRKRYRDLKWSPSRAFGERIQVGRRRVRANCS